MGGSEPASLSAAAYLAALKSNSSFHELYDRRHPLGMYNLSVGRICDKIKKCAQKFEEYYLSSPYIADLDKKPDLRDEIIDYLELSLYAAAEHVDDVESIGSSFFSTSQKCAKFPVTKELKRAIKPLRDQISSFVNTIKHTQGRIRLSAVEFRHGEIDNCLHGFFIEGVSSGVIGPSPILHNESKMVISITSLLWSLVTYLGLISLELTKFLSAISAVDEAIVTPRGSQTFRNAIIALARLPLYSLDDVHPFERVRIVINLDEESRAAVESNIYGSLLHPWSASDQVCFGASRFMYEGDGVSKNFRIIQPRKIQLRRWGS
jgi:hypothetical protein